MSGKREGTGDLWERASVTTFGQEGELSNILFYPWLV